MYLHFDDAALALDNNNRNLLEELLTKWSECNWMAESKYASCNHSVLIENIKRERFIPKDTFSEILACLVGHYKEMNIESCLSNFQNEAYSKFMRKGGRVEEHPVYVATVMDRNIFTNYLSASNEEEMSQEEINKLLKKQPSEFFPHEKKLLLKKSSYQLWFTWDENLRSDPFAFLEKINTENIIKSLALNENVNKEMLIFYFKVEDSKKCKFYRPTWCDSDFFDKFRPADLKETKWGQTFPTEEYAIKEGFSVRRPEGVVLSSNIKLSYLNKKIVSV